MYIYVIKIGALFRTEKSVTEKRKKRKTIAVKPMHIARCALNLEKTILTAFKGIGNHCQVRFALLLSRDAQQLINLFHVAAHRPFIRATRSQQ